MSEDRLILAIGRLERALSRVETVAGSDDRNEAALLALTARHEKLKHQVESAIDALDRLIGKG